MSKHKWGGDRSPYWNWVGRNGGLEPIENNPDNMVDPASIEPAASTNHSAKFAVWLVSGYERLTERQKQVFGAAFQRQLSDAAGAAEIGISTQRYSNIKSRVRAIIAEEVGIKL